METKNLPYLYRYSWEFAYLRTMKIIFLRQFFLYIGWTIGLFLFLASPIFAQSHSSKRRQHRKVVRSVAVPQVDVYNQYLDSLNQLKTRYQTWRYEKEDTLSNPYYFYLFLPPTMYDDVAARQINPPSKPQNRKMPTSSPLTKETEERLNMIDQVLMNTYVEAPWLIRYEAKDVPLAITTAPENEATEVKPKVNFTERVNQSDPTAAIPGEDNDWDIAVRKPNFWTFKANPSLQLTQNYVSDNWYQGGESNNSFLAQVIIDANFDNKKKFIFTNKLEMKLGFQTSKGDDQHKLRTNADLIRMTNKIGHQATKHWYYALTLQSWTQFYPSYRKNDPKVYSDFMSPFESLLTIGMDYKLNTKKFNLNASLSPLAGHLTYVDRKDLAASRGWKEGKHSKFDIGSNITVTYTWNMFKNVSWSGRIYYYTNYDNTKVEWENTFNLTINKFLKTKLFLYPRFDDGATRKEGHSYFQFYELLSLGIDYKF